MRYYFLKLMTPILAWIGKIQLPETEMPWFAFENVKDIIQNGDIVLSHKKWALSNIGIPGFWKHATIYCDGFIIEAIGTGVQEVPLIKWLYCHDAIVVLRPKFCEASDRSLAAYLAHSQIGKPYDYLFDFSVSAFYCSELIHWAYREATNNLSPFTLRKTLGVETVSPSDFYNATEKFEKLIEFNYR